jgi:type VI protein secretion system component VasK
MFLVMAPLIWLLQQLGQHPWLWLVVIAVVIGGWLLGREQSYKPPRRRHERRPSIAQVRDDERARFEERGAELQRAYRDTKDRLRRLSD